MSKVECKPFTLTSTGTDTINLDDYNLDITHLVLFVGDSSTEYAAGFSDGTTTFTGSRSYSEENLTKTLTYYRNIGGVKTKTLETVVTSIGVGTFSINTTTLSGVKQLAYVAYGN